MKNSGTTDPPPAATCPPVQREQLPASTGVPAPQPAAFHRSDSRAAAKAQVSSTAEQVYPDPSSTRRTKSRLQSAHVSAY